MHLYKHFSSDQVCVLEGNPPQVLSTYCASPHQLVSVETKPCAVLREYLGQASYVLALILLSRRCPVEPHWRQLSELNGFLVWISLAFLRQPPRGSEGYCNGVTHDAPYTPYSLLLVNIRKFASCYVTRTASDKGNLVMPGTETRVWLRSIFWQGPLKC